MEAYRLRRDGMVPSSMTKEQTMSPLRASPHAGRGRSGDICWRMFVSGTRAAAETSHYGIQFLLGRAGPGLGAV